MYMMRRAFRDSFRQKKTPLPNIKWGERNAPKRIRSTSFGVFGEKSEYDAPSSKPFMINFRVNNLDALMVKLKSEGVEIIGEFDRFEYGNFRWIMNPEGNKIELRGPIDAVLEAYEEQQRKE
jgi:predicted enzyme related to lactoylglutathione lyase